MSFEKRKDLRERFWKKEGGSILVLRFDFSEDLRFDFGMI